MDKSVEIYILTHKKITEPYDASLYKPILNGSINASEDFGYIRDDSGDNISDLNDYYGELSGEYWVWKHSNADIIGFCHYRRWYARNLTWKKLTKEDIIKDLKKYDIILPHNLHFTKSLYDMQKETDITEPNYDATYEDYFKVEQVLEKYFPDYAKCYHDVMNGKKMWAFTIFISTREVADGYFNWVFSVFDKLSEEIDLKKYDRNLRDPRIFAFIAERLLTVYVIKNNLKVKEYETLFSERILPIVPSIFARFPRFRKVEKFGYRVLDNLLSLFQ